jgi:hypothetical protein
MSQMKRTAWPLIALCLSLASCGEELQEVPRTSEFPATAQVSVHQEFERDLAAPRHSSDGGGRVRLVLADGDDGSVVCASRGRWEFEYEAGPEGIAVGGALLFLAPPFWGWSTPQSEVPERVGFTTVSCSAPGVELEARTVDQSLLRIQVSGRALQAGESLRIVYGASEALAVADTYAERESRFYFKVDGDGDGISELVPEMPAITVHPGPAARLAATLPSTAEPGESLELSLAVLDVFANAGVRFEGTVRLESIPVGLELPELWALDAAAGGLARLPCRAEQPGTWRVRASIELESGETVSRLSNPLRVAPGVRRVYWGDLHGHSGLSDGTGTPGDYFSYARDVSALDLVVLTDHDHFGVRFLDSHPELWDEIQRTVREVSEPGKFLALPGYEWTSWLYGHRHVLYLDGAEQQPLLSSLSQDAHTPADLWGALRGKQALTIAHHSAGGPVATDWSFEPDPLLEPVTEVMSVHGSSEAWDSPARIYSAVRGNFVRDQLERGLLMGFIGSGDGHDGHPGHAHLAPNAGYRRARPDPREQRAAERLGNGGLAALRAPELTAAGVLAAMRARDVYATSGPRIWLATALAGHRMGSEVPASDLGHETTLVIAASGCSNLEYVELIRRGRPIERIDCRGELDVHFELGLQDLQPGDFVYVRVLQNDGGMAWSSPFYVR